jgi:MFS family permease
MRTALAVVVGYVLFAVSAVVLFPLAHRDPHAAASLGFTLLAIAYGIAFGAISGWVARRLARRIDLLAPICVAGIIALGAAISLAATWRVAAHWSQWAAIFLMAPAAIAGGAVAPSSRAVTSGAS